jgi:hypothetical protein
MDLLLPLFGGLSLFTFSVSHFLSTWGKQPALLFTETSIVSLLNQTFLVTSDSSLPPVPVEAFTGITLGWMFLGYLVWILLVVRQRCHVNADQDAIWRLPRRQTTQPSSPTFSMEWMFLAWVRMIVYPLFSIYVFTSTLHPSSMVFVCGMVSLMLSLTLVFLLGDFMTDLLFVSMQLDSRKKKGDPSFIQFDLYPFVFVTVFIGVFILLEGLFFQSLRLMIEALPTPMEYTSSVALWMFVVDVILASLSHLGNLFIIGSVYTSDSVQGLYTHLFAWKLSGITSLLHIYTVVMVMVVTSMLC